MNKLTPTPPSGQSTHGPSSFWKELQEDEARFRKQVARLDKHHTALGLSMGRRRTCVPNIVTGYERLCCGYDPPSKVGVEE